MSTKTEQPRPPNPFNDNFQVHISHIQNIPNEDQVQYMNFTHSIAWTFNKEKKCKITHIIIILNKKKKINLKI